jgi:hypothetical protein
VAGPGADVVAALRYRGRAALATVGSAICAGYRLGTTVPLGIVIGSVHGVVERHAALRTVYSSGV